MKYEDGKDRCFWCNPENELYMKYHDEEWGVLNLDDEYLFEMLILESFQAGLSWETILNKRENFKKAFDNFNLDKVIGYDDEKIDELMHDKGIIRHKLKIASAINNAKVFKDIQTEYGSFNEYLKTYTGEEIIYENDKTTSPLSEEISKDLKRKGMKFVGSTIIYSYLQAIGIINSHMDNCFLYKKGE
ncbi:MAG: DNA-3-methyladenine glycosylase I [Methanosphaera sp.]|nr:DNA-3-methyladenine glycosylase I [Methanosphaera sp.]